MTTPLIGALVPSTSDPSTVREIAIGTARDAMAARMIVDAAEKGNPHAAVFADEAQGILGAAQVRRHRARRLREASARAAMGGYHEVARWGAEAATKETRAAERLEAAVVQGVRESHSPGAFGYISPEEQRFLRNKTALESMTQAQLEQTFSSLLTRISGGADNFGADGDDDEEVGSGEAAEQLAIAAALYGGDLPAVFGANVYVDIGGLFKPSAKRLRKRLARKQKRLAKAEAKLEPLEDAGKKGLRVKMLRMRVRRLEKGISRIEGKLEKLEGADGETKKSKRKARKMARAETQLVKEAISDKEEDDIEDTEADEEMAAAVEIFGLRPRRARRIRRRVRRLRRHAAGARGRRRRHFRRRASRLRARLHPRFRRRRRFRRLVRTPVAPYPAPFPVDQGYVSVADPAFVEPEPEEEEEEEREEFEDQDEAMGLEPDPADDEATGRGVLVGFFAERAAVYGAHDLDPSDTVTFGKGFFEATGDWFRNLWTGGKAKVKAHKSATQRARAARAPHTPRVKSGRRVVRSRRQKRREAGRGARRGTILPFKKGRKVKGVGGFVYIQTPDGAIEVDHDPTGHFKSGTVLRSGVAHAAITREIGPYSKVGTDMSAFGVDLVGLMAPTVGAGFFEQLASPTTKRDRVMVLAQQLDKAVKSFGPQSAPAKELKAQVAEAADAADEEGPDSPLSEDDLDEMDDDLAFAFGVDEGDDDQLGAIGARRARRGRRLRRMLRRRDRAQDRGHSRRAGRIQRKIRRRVTRWRRRPAKDAMYG